MMLETRKMNIDDFIKNYQNHPVLFIGTGFSLRYLENSFSWDGLLQHIAEKMDNNDEKYLELKVQHNHKNFDQIASILEQKIYRFSSAKQRPP
ncbi:hypothetical protein [Vespertiliibacter pulmonis]|uniref:hypothetical protein n=1 Tax=Vespertiliibacter pulmonis TaxID=1443036 RepID=UPI001C401132|nr:hypothetical protein [Vespertiliibacter pulmonis]